MPLTKESSIGIREINVLDPCVPYNMVSTVQVLNSSDNKSNASSYVRIIGSGKFQACKDKLVNLLNTSIKCESEHCKMNGIYHPENYEPPFFYGFSEFWYTMEDVLRMGGKYSRSSFEAAASVSCAFFLQF